MYIEDFLPTQAFPIASILILICSASTYYSGVKHKLENPDSDFVNLDFVIIYTPMMLLGTKLGTIFNKVFSSFILFLILILILITSFQKTYKSAWQNHGKEQIMEKQGYQELEDLKTASKNDQDLNGNIKRPIKNSPKSPINESQIEIKRKTSKNSRESNHKEEIEQEIKINSSLIHEDLSKEENNPLRLDRLKYIIYFEIISLLNQMVEGNSKIPSFIGIKKCSATYWLVFMIHVGFTVYCTNEMFKVLKLSFEFKKCVLPSFKDPQFEYIQENKTRIALMGLVAGLVGGMIGVGGGMISNPLLLAMGFNPKVTTSTSNFLILLSSFSATIIFIFAGQINYEFAFFLGVPCGISAFYGSNYIQLYIKRTKKSAFLLFLLCGLQIASAILLIFSNFSKVNNDIRKGNSLFGVNNFC